MKTRKVNKRLSKLDELLAELSKSYSKGALHVHAAFEGAKVAIAHLRATVNQAPAASAGKSDAPSRRAVKVGKRKLSLAHRRAIQEGMRRRAMAKKSSSPTEKRTTKKTGATSRKKAAAG